MTPPRTRVERLRARRTGPLDRLLAWLRLDDHENGALLWSTRLTLVVSAVGAAVIVVALLTFEAVAVVGVVAIFVALLGRVTTVIELRYAGVPLAQPPGPGAGTGTRTRATLLRSSGAAYVMAAIGAVAGLVNGGIGIAIIGAAVLLGPAARFVVTPRHLHIDTAFHRISVPRRLIGTFERSGLEIRLRLTDQDFYDLRVDSPILDLRDGHRWRLNSRCLVRTAERLAGMLRDVPAEPGAGGEVEILRRTGSIVFTAVVVLAVAAAVVLSLRG